MLTDRKVTQGAILYTDPEVLVDQNPHISQRIGLGLTVDLIYSVKVDLKDIDQDRYQLFKIEDHMYIMSNTRKIIVDSLLLRNSIGNYKSFSN